MGSRSAGLTVITARSDRFTNRISEDAEPTGVAQIVVVHRGGVASLPVERAARGCSSGFHQYSLVGRAGQMPLNRITRGKERALV